MYNRQKYNKNQSFTPTPNFLLSKNGTLNHKKKNNSVWRFTPHNLFIKVGGFTPLEKATTQIVREPNSLTGFTPPTFARKVGGFTLVEMMVSLGIFTMVLSVSVGALLSMVNSNRKTQSLRSAMDNLNIAMEEITRNITQGRKYHCGTNDFSSYPVAGIEQELKCPSGEDHFLAIEAHGGDLSDATDQFVYKLDKTTGRLQKSIDSGNNFVDITAPSIVIDHLKFYVFDKDLIADGVNEPPRVVITIGGTAGTKEGVQSEFNLQATVTQRAPE